MRDRRLLLRLLATGAFLALVGLVVEAGPASAHARLVSISPTDRALLSTAPTKVVLVFDDRVIPGFSVISVKTLGGQSVTKGVTESVRGTVTQALQPLAAGSYAVAWKVVSDDSHPVSGTSRFRVSVGPADGGSATSASSSSSAASATEAATVTGLPDPAANGSTTPPSQAAGSAPAPARTPQGALWLVGLALLVVGVLGWVKALRRRHPTHGGDG